MVPLQWGKCWYEAVLNVMIMGKLGEKTQACSLLNTDKPDHISPPRPPWARAVSWVPRPSTSPPLGDSTAFDASFHTAVTGKITAKFYWFNY